MLITLYVKPNAVELFNSVKLRISLGLNKLMMRPVWADVKHSLSSKEGFIKCEMMEVDYKAMQAILDNCSYNCNNIV